MTEWDDVLRDLADDPEDFERAGGTISLRRRGDQYTFEMRIIPGVGPCACFPDGRSEPIEVFIQKDLLRLPYLASQICRTLERFAERRPTRFIEGPAEAYAPGGAPIRWDRTLENLKKAIISPEMGTTHIIELMASAGQGKTVLLEQVATDSVLSYQAEQYPHPIVFPVDLLGRHVGNIDDAIAGSLNNTYASPGLTQSDVVLCLRRAWLVLALDGFDELVARVGVSDAFTHVRELVDQLEGSGTILLSARATFFELYEIASGIRRFLTPGDGSYTTTVVKLLPWEKKQGRELFSAMGSDAPEKELDNLLDLFQEDQKIVFHPFFLTRLAVLWKKGEAFHTLPGRAEGLARAKWVIDTFIEREHQDKWTGRDGRPLLTAEQHILLLGGIAEEMWTTGAFRLNTDELRIAAQIGLADLKLPADTLEQVSGRVATHAALASNGKQFSFFHDQFLNYALGHRLALYLTHGALEQVTRLLAPKTLPPDVIDWMAWFFHQGSGDIVAVARGMNDIASRGSASASLSENLSLILARLFDGTTDGGEFTQQKFFGDALANSRCRRIIFTSCSFWEIDLSGTRLESCAFQNCEFGSVLTNGTTSLEGSIFTECKLGPIQSATGGTVFSPTDIVTRLRALGARIDDGADGDASMPPVDRKVSDCLEYVVTLSEKTCDVAVEEVEERYPGLAYDLLKKANAASIVRKVSRPTAGPRKTFYRFQVDREEFLAGQGRLTHNKNIDGFWKNVATEYPGTDRGD